MKAFERLFFVIYIPLGLWGCLNAGISWDEFAENQTLIVNIGAVKGLLGGSSAEYLSLLNYGDRYYGVGFHLISNVITTIAFWVNSHIFSFSAIPSEILFAHLSVFTVFALSGVVVKSIVEKLINNLAMSRIGMMAYLLWPYLLGHAFVNVKDIPFLFAWLLCTNIYLEIMRLWYSQFSCGKKQALLHFFLLGLGTAWLLSIRISGLLIFIEYAVCFLVYLLLGKCRLKQAFSATHLAAFVLPLGIGVFVFYPVFWHNPLEVLNAIRYMSQHPWDGNTLTAGRFLSPGQLTYFYIPAWLIIKLPILLIMGLLVSPLTLYRSLSKEKNYPSGLSLLNFIGIFLSTGSILLALVIIKAGLYNELRQILFIFPLIYIISFTSLYYISKKFLFIGLTATSIFFIADNFVLYPYSYIYINELARQANISTQYEKDYLGLSISPTTIWLNQQRPIHDEVICAVVNPTHLWERLDRTKYPCIQGYENFATLKNPFIFSWLIRDRIDLLPLPTCRLIHEEKVSLPLSPAELVMNQLFFCDPNISGK